MREPFAWVEAALFRSTDTAILTPHAISTLFPSAAKDFVWFPHFNSIIPMVTVLNAFVAHCSFRKPLETPATTLSFLKAKGVAKIPIGKQVVACVSPLID